jgi:ADP-ribose pyrophosphatase
VREDRLQLATRRVYSGKVVRLDVDTVRFPDGSTGELELIRHPGAAAVIPCATDPGLGDPTILMIRQFRYAAAGLLWEIPAGTLAPGEAPEAGARRELLEEAGVTAERVEPLTSVWTTPGFTDETIHLFWAHGLTRGIPAREPDEFIEVVPRPLSEVLAGIAGGEIRDAKTMVAILYMARFVLGR